MKIHFDSPVPGRIVLKAFKKALGVQPTDYFRWHRYMPVEGADRRGEVVYLLTSSGVQQSHCYVIEFRGEMLDGDGEGLWDHAWQFEGLGSFALMEINPYKTYGEIDVRWGTVLPEREAQVLRNVAHFEWIWKSFLRNFLTELNQRLKAEGLVTPVGLAAE